MCKMSTCSLIKSSYVMYDSKMGAPELVVYRMPGFSLVTTHSQPLSRQVPKTSHCLCIQTLPGQSTVALGHFESTMEAVELPELQVLVHCFSRCYCRSNTFSADHIKVKTLNHPVESGQAVALSYGIGDFDRQKHLFGHVDGPEPEPELVRLEFGGEWEIQGFMDALVTLSEKHGAIWFDQLSIPQDPASITLHLQNMPRIYREFEVVVLLPNAPCPCLADAFDSWQSDGLYTANYLNGDFDIYAVARRCRNAFPVSSYHFRLWTKQESTYARAISVFYCGAPGKCYIDTFERPDFENEPTPPESSGHLSRWASWKYASYTGMTSNNSEFTRVMKWTKFATAHRDGELNLCFGILSFFGKKAYNAIEAEKMVYSIGAHTARFLLGGKLQRAWHESEDEFAPSDLESEHVVTLQRDFALAVLLPMGGYRLPQGHADMTLPELVDAGIEQIQEHEGGCFKTMLPRGLFEDGIPSMAAKPSLYLRTEYIECLRDVYGSFSGGMFPNIDSPRGSWMTLLHLRDVPRTSARLPQSNTYEEVSDSASTAEVCDFMRRIPEIGMIQTRNRIKAHGPWARAVISGEVSAPVDSWPSPVHEQAIFEESILDGQAWGSWPEINHRNACYNIMCDHVRIHPEVAREKGLGLIVKVSNPPCIGLVNRVVYDKIRGVEQCQRHHGSSAADILRRDRGVHPQDWLTIALNRAEDERHLTLEAIMSNTLPQGIDYDCTLNPRYIESVPVYTVRGVWFTGPGGDPCIGADLARKSQKDYSAILI
jgi:hypothetical protein